MGTRSKGPFENRRGGDERRGSTYRYRPHFKDTKLGRRIRRNHGRKFSNLLGYRLTQKYRDIGTDTGRRSKDRYHKRAKRLR